MLLRIQQALLRKGYFPRELPPAFVTDDFGLYSREIIADWRSNRIFLEEPEQSRTPTTRKKRRHSYNFTLTPTEAEIISMPKRGYERRILHITHPLPQALLASELSAHWKSVSKMAISANVLARPDKDINAV